MQEMQTSLHRYQRASLDSSRYSGYESSALATAFGLTPNAQPSSDAKLFNISPFVMLSRQLQQQCMPRTQSFADISAAAQTQNTLMRPVTNTMYASNTAPARPSPTAQLSHPGQSAQLVEQLYLSSLLSASTPSLAQQCTFAAVPLAGNHPTGMSSTSSSRFAASPTKCIPSTTYGTQMCSKVADRRMFGGAQAPDPNAQNSAARVTRSGLVRLVASPQEPLLGAKLVAANASCAVAWDDSWLDDAICESWEKDALDQGDDECMGYPELGGAASGMTVRASSLHHTSDWFQGSQGALCMAH